MTASSTKYLSGLDSLRWYSALAVIITHVELHKGYHGLPNIWASVWVQNLGPVGVYFFFTLSGFLITWLLQKQRTCSLAAIFPAFYLRRASRILPLYYAMVVLGFFVLPYIPTFCYSNRAAAHGNAELLTFLSGQPHVASSFLGRVPNISHLWSIGVELTFYCFWPLVILRSRCLKRVIIIFTIGILALKGAILVVGEHLLKDPRPLYHFAATLKFECMAIGSWFALSHKQSEAGVLDSPLLQWLAFLVVPLIFLLYGTPLDNVVHVLLAVVFGIIVRGAAFCGQSPVRFLDNPVANYLGRISYGIYCFHVMFITLTLNVLSTGKHGIVFDNVAIYSVTLLLTIAVSVVSFEFFESPITRKARRIESVPSLKTGSTCG